MHSLPWGIGRQCTRSSIHRELIDAIQPAIYAKNSLQPSFSGALPAYPVCQFLATGLCQQTRDGGCSSTTYA